MWFCTKKREMKIWNTDNDRFISLENVREVLIEPAFVSERETVYKIVASFPEDPRIILGEYSTKGVAEEIFVSLFKYLKE
jgi:hypothetical protein